MKKISIRGQQWLDFASGYAPPVSPGSRLLIEKYPEEMRQMLRDKRMNQEDCLSFAYMCMVLAERFSSWSQFVDAMLDHIETYTVPQYGDKPNDQAEGFDAKTIIVQLGRYLNRRFTNSRGPEESFRDLLKMAHYACLLAAKTAQETADVCDQTL